MLDNSGYRPAPGHCSVRPRLRSSKDIVQSTDNTKDVEQRRYVPGYFDNRLAYDRNRMAVWGHICRYLERWIPSESDVLELGAGWCDFSNQVTARSVVAVDVDSIVERSAEPHVRSIVGDARDLRDLDDDSFDVVFASNLLEHLNRDDTRSLLGEAARLLRPDGRLILLQPNFRLNPGRYFDDFTHVSIFTDQSLPDYLSAEGWIVADVRARFLPLTMKSGGSRLSFLVPWYLRSPWKPLAGQMLVVARPQPNHPIGSGT